MGDLGKKDISEALADLASPREPAAAGVASAVTAATAAGVVELTATLAARRIAEQDRGNGDGAADRMRDLAQQAGKLRGRLLSAADEDARAYARVIKARQGHEQSRALDRASDPPLAIAEGAAAVAERAAEVADAGNWTFTADAVVAGELAAAAARMRPAGRSQSRRRTRRSPPRTRPCRCRPRRARQPQCLGQRRPDEAVHGGSATG
jgi:formiminotetrahydrofolate cyclodeaminase